jgi:hypothetical protein
MGVDRIAAGIGNPVLRLVRSAQQAVRCYLCIAAKRRGPASTTPPARFVASSLLPYRRAEAQLRGFHRRGRRCLRRSRRPGPRGWIVAFYWRRSVRRYATTSAILAVRQLPHVRGIADSRATSSDRTSFFCHRHQPLVSSMICTCACLRSAAAPDGLAVAHHDSAPAG